MHVLKLAFSQIQRGIRGALLERKDEANQPQQIGLCPTFFSAGRVGGHGCSYAPRRGWPRFEERVACERFGCKKVPHSQSEFLPLFYFALSVPELDELDLISPRL